MSKHASKEKVVEPIVEPAPSFDDDDAALRALGYKPSFKREFSNISTVSLFSFCTISSASRGTRLK